MRPVVLAVLASGLIAVPSVGDAQEPPAPATGTAPAPAPPVLAAPAPAPAAPAGPETATPVPEALTPSAPSAAPPATPMPPAPWDRLQPTLPGTDKPELHSGFAANLGVGLPIPFGDVSHGDSLSKLLTVQFPSISLEVGANIIPALFIGAYGTYGLGATGKSAPFCQQGVAITCSAHSFRAGIAVAYRWLLGERLRPWVGYGIGYEWEDTSFKSVVPGLSSKIDYNGWEYGHFKLGLDVQATRAYGAGPYIDLGIGKYRNVNGEVAGVTLESSPGSAVHEWLTFGFRGTFGP